MNYFSIKNWEKYQHYKDRNPPWIKLHKDLLHDYDFSCLQDASKLHLMLIWLLASQMDNQIPCDPDWLKNALHTDTPIDLKALSDSGFIDIDITLLADCNHVAMPETEAETETKIHRSKIHKQKRFDDYWSEYPKHVKKKTAVEIWQRKQLDSVADEIIDDIKIRIKKDRRWLEGFIPDPTTYLNQERWNDDLEPEKPKEKLVLHASHKNWRDAH